MSSATMGEVTELVRRCLEQAERAIHGLGEAADVIADADPHAVYEFLRGVEDGLRELAAALEEEPHLKVVK